jgi:hypothetical protein
MFSRSQWPRGLRSLERCDRGFKSHWKHESLSVCFILCLCFSCPCEGLISRPRSPTVCVIMITKLKNRPGRNKGLLSHWWMNESINQSIKMNKWKWTKEHSVISRKIEISCKYLFYPLQVKQWNTGESNARSQTQMFSQEFITKLSWKCKYSLSLPFAPTLAHRASVKLCVSLQFLNPIHSRLDSLDRGSSRRKAATCTQNNSKTEYTYTDIHASSGIRIHDIESANTSCLRVRPLWSAI